MRNLELVSTGNALYDARSPRRWAETLRSSVTPLGRLGVRVRVETVLFELDVVVPSVTLVARVVLTVTTISKSVCDSWI